MTLKFLKLHNSKVDRLIIYFDKLVLRHAPPFERDPAALMRMNYCGEICAQALYQAQAIAAREDSLATTFVECAQKKEEHLKWCDMRIQELNAKTSALNHACYSTGFILGLFVGLLGDKLSLAFLNETEHQVVDHLKRQIALLPPQDTQNRAILEHMQQDGEAILSTLNKNVTRLPAPISWLMRIASKILTKTAY